MDEHQQLPDDFLSDLLAESLEKGPSPSLDTHTQWNAMDFFSWAIESSRELGHDLSPLDELDAELAPAITENQASSQSAIPSDTPLQITGSKHELSYDLSESSSSYQAGAVLPLLPLGEQGPYEALVEGQWDLGTVVESKEQVRWSAVPAQTRFPCAEPVRTSQLEDGSNGFVASSSKLTLTSGQLVFDRAMVAARPRKLRKKTQADLEARRTLRNSGGACEKHKAARKACRCFASKRQSLGCVDAAKKVAQPVMSSIATIDRKSPGFPDICNNDNQICADEAEADINVPVEALKQQNVQQILQPAADADDLPKHILVFTCPYMFAACNFWAFDKKEWEDHLIMVHGERFDPAAQVQPDLLFQDDNTTMTLM